MESLKLLKASLDFLSESTEIYNPGFPLKVRNRVICASEQNNSDNLDLTTPGFKINSKHRVSLYSINDEVLESFEKKEKGTQTDFLGAVLLCAYRDYYKLYARQFNTPKTKVSYTQLVERILGINSSLTGVFLNSIDLFPANSQMMLVDYESQDLSPENVYKVLKCLVMKG
jgi:hypothetical protein